MSIETLIDLMPDYAKDIRSNIGNLFKETLLNDQQKYGCFLASALGARNANVIKLVAAEVKDKMSPEALEAAKAAAAIMAMNNVYYRSIHIMENSQYGKMPAKLRMNVVGNPGIEKVDFELWSIAVSAINGCGMCLDAHDKVVLKHGITHEQVQAAMRIASVVQAAAAILDGEEALQ